MTGFPLAIADGWHPVATAAQLRAKPLSRMLMGRPLAVFRATTGPAVLIDRCPHRNLALSAGRLRDGDIECPYHGWRFSGDGRCTATPGFDQPAHYAATTLPAIERSGLIWTTLAADLSEFPVLPDPIDWPGFDSFWWAVRPSRARVIDAIENLLDPAHPHFVHSGIVRSAGNRRLVEVTVRVGADRAEAIYVENARPQALISRLLEGTRTRSAGRFFPPSTGQITFEGPSGVRLAITVFFTPVDADHIRPFAHFATPRGILPAVFKRIVLRALNGPVLLQDRAILRAQAENIDRFGGSNYAMGPLDFLLPAIQALAAAQMLPETQHRISIQL